MQAVKALASLHICTGLHEPSFLDTAVSTKANLLAHSIIKLLR